MKTWMNLSKSKTQQSDHGKAGSFLSTCYPKRRNRQFETTFNDELKRRVRLFKRLCKPENDWTEHNLKHLFESFLLHPDAALGDPNGYDENCVKYIEFIKNGAFERWDVKFDLTGVILPISGVMRSWAVQLVLRVQLPLVYPNTA